MSPGISGLWSGNGFFPGRESIAVRTRSCYHLYWPDELVRRVRSPRGEMSPQVVYSGKPEDCGLPLCVCWGVPILVLSISATAVRKRYSESKQSSIMNSYASSRPSPTTRPTVCANLLSTSIAGGSIDAIRVLESILQRPATWLSGDCHLQGS
jgi:hypothetical protein